MRIPLIKPDLPALNAIEEPLREVLSAGRVTNFGKYVTEFEQSAGERLGTQVVSLSSGTQALVLTLQALGVGSGDKVVLPSFTFMATAQAVLYAGGIPVFAEIEDDLTISTSDLQLLLDKHHDVRAVIGVHMYGLPCRVDQIKDVVERAQQERRVALVYDAAHAFGSAVNGRPVGVFGEAEVFSLSVTKALVSVEGGLVSSQDPQLLQRIRKMRNYGIEDSYNANYPGLNGKMSELHAIIGLYNLERLTGYLALRQRSARYYLDRVGSYTKFRTLPWPHGVTHTFKDFTVITPEHLEGRRDDVIAFLKDRGVETRAYFHPPVHEQSFFKTFADRQLPRTEALARRVITLPFFTTITSTEMDYVVDTLAEAERRIA